MSLKIRVRNGLKPFPTGCSKKPRILIAIPKKVIRLAVGRNRLRRLIREAIRNDDFFKDRQKVYSVYVHQQVEGLKMNQVKETLEALK